MNWREIHSITSHLFGWPQLYGKKWKLADCSNESQKCTCRWKVIIKKSSYKVVLSALTAPEPCWESRGLLRSLFIQKASSEHCVFVQALNISKATVLKSSNALLMEVHNRIRETTTKTIRCTAPYEEQCASCWCGFQWQNGHLHHLKYVISCTNI